MSGMSTKIGFSGAGFQLGTDEPQSAIIAVIMPDLERGAAMWEALLKEGKMDRMNKALLADSGAIFAGSLLGTSSTTAYIESAAGIGAAAARGQRQRARTGRVAGGRSGWRASPCPGPS